MPSEYKQLGLIKKYKQSSCIVNCIPSNLFGRCSLLCEYLRVLILSIVLVLDSSPIDLLVIDQYCFLIPLLRLKTNKLFFLCNGSDLVQSDVIGLFPKCMHRLIFTIVNVLAQLCASMASQIIVESIHA